MELKHIRVVYIAPKYRSIRGRQDNVFLGSIDEYRDAWSFREDKNVERPITEEEYNDINLALGKLSSHE